MPKAIKPAEAPRSELILVPLDELIEPELPARENMDETKMLELMESMGSIGLLHPLTVVRADKGYEIVAGHRRYLAARELHWKQIPCLIFSEKGVAIEAARAHENLVREDLNAAEEAVWYAQLIEQHKLDESALCELVRRKPDYIGDRLRLLRGDADVFQCVRDGRITFGVGRELNKITDDGIRRFYLDTAVRSGTSHRVVSQWVADWKAQQFAPPAAAVPAPDNGELPGPAPFHLCCELCGGDRDPYNLVSIHLHKWELEEIKRLLAKAGQGVQ